ncbi:MAG TPA: hypothetical protein VFR70_01155, partial [Flavobacterium sp.]|nr:hypothetical protein [Flavobacterium sp.]
NMKKYILIAILFAGSLGFAQKSINDYKYAIVPVKYEFLRSENLYRLNTITKYRLKELGFEAFYANEDLPLEIADDKCGRLYVDVEKVSSLLATKLVVTFKDCQNNIVFRSEEGKSREKEFKLAYPEALENAFKSLNLLGYRYNGSKMPGTSSAKPAAVAAVPKSSPGIDEAKDYLFAQPIANGYQLVDKTPKVVLKIFKTSQPDYYTAQSETINGAVIRKNGEWILEYYKDDRPVSEKLLIKF